jgi:hypothetical protein
MSFADPKFGKLLFEVGSLRFAYAFHTETSLSLTVQSAASQFTRGWIDVHYPCREQIKVQFRGALAEADLNPATIREIIGALILRLEIPSGETYEANFFKASSQIQMAQSTGEEGMTDRIETVRSFTLPKD